MYYLTVMNITTCCFLKIHMIEALVPNLNTIEMQYHKSFL